MQKSLQSLLETLDRSHPYFVRCIKSNNSKTPCLFDEEVILRQLQYTGMLATVRLRQSGYNYRVIFQVRLPPLLNRPLLDRPLLHLPLLDCPLNRLLLDWPLLSLPSPRLPAPQSASYWLTSHLVLPLLHPPLLGLPLLSNLSSRSCEHICHQSSASAVSISLSLFTRSLYRITHRCYLTGRTALKLMWRPSLPQWRAIKRVKTSSWAGTE